MKRNPVNLNRFPGYYRQDFLQKQREKLNLKIEQVSEGSGVKLDSTRRVFLGEATSKQVYPIAEFLNLDWSMLHDLTLPESDFHRAVKNGRAKR